MVKFKKGLESVGVYKPGKPIEEVKREMGLNNVCKLASNEIPYPPRYIRKAILKELDNINRYPESGCFYLRNALSKKLNVSPEQLVFGNGSDELIVLALKAYVDPGDEVVVAYPTFLIYGLQAKIFSAHVRQVPLKNYRYDLDSMARLVNERTKIIFIANPDNPTGTYISAKEVKEFLKKIPSSVLVFFDEAYFEFTSKDFPETQKLLNERENIIVSRTFSKAYGLAGLRIGYVITTPEIAQMLNKVREPFNINRFAQVAALQALRSKSFLRKVIRCVNIGKRFMYAGLAKLDVSFVESATNFILIDMKHNAKPVCRFLLENGIIVRDLGDWGFKNCFRVTIGTQKENERFLEMFKKFLC